MTERRRRRNKHLLNDLKEDARCWELNDEELDCSPWRTRLSRGYGPVENRLRNNGE